MKLLILGSARHGKDTVAELLKKNFGLPFQSSSLAASELFIYDALKEKYGYQSHEECFADRGNHRSEWYRLIKEYNDKDKTKLARSILSKNDVYVGMRERSEVQACREQKLFHLIVGVYDPRKPEENKNSFNINLWEDCDVVLPNASTLSNLEEKVKQLGKFLVKNLEV